MALKLRKTTRFLARVGTWIAVAISFLGGVLESFLNFKEGDGLLKKGVRTVDLAARQAIYFVADYGLWLVSVGIFTAMKTFGFSFLWIFAALWAYEFVAAGAFTLFYEKTGKDLSLGEDFRRATDTIREKSRLAGYAAMVPIALRAIFWTGPEKAITFFRKEIGTIPRVIIVLLVLTAIQSLVWAYLYDLGYGLITG